MFVHDVSDERNGQFRRLYQFVLHKEDAQTATQLRNFKINFIRTQLSGEQIYGFPWNA